MLAILLTSTLTMQGMENNNSKPERPTINAQLYFTELPACYATEKQINYLNKKGISTPVHPIIRFVSKVVVQGTSKTDWLKAIPFSIRNYDKQSGRYNKNIDTATIEKIFKDSNKTFPHFLPAELALNCTNNSHINLTIEKFQVNITFASKNDFYAEHKKCLSDFFQNPNSITPEEATQELIASEMLREIEVDGVLSFTDALTGQHTDLPITYIDYTHGPNGCPDEKTFIQKIIDDKIPTHQSPFKAIMDRQLNGSFK